MSNTILRIPQVMAKTGLAKSTIYLLIKEGNFPSSIQLGQRSIGFIEAEIDKWIESKISNSKKERENV